MCHVSCSFRSRVPPSPGIRRWISSTEIPFAEFTVSRLSLGGVEFAADSPLEGDGFPDRSTASSQLPEALRYIIKRGTALIRFTTDARLETGNNIADNAIPWYSNLPVSFCPSLQMAGKVLVHLEHRHLVLAEDPSELFVRQDLASVLWVLQVVQANVLPHLAHPCPRGSGSEPTTAANSSD